MPRPHLTIPNILAWADAHMARTGQWPKSNDGLVRGSRLGTTWRQVENALRLGLRGLPGKSSVAKLLSQHRGYRNIHCLPPLTEQEILRWSDNHFHCNGRWPTENSGPVADASGETWENINAALRTGNRGLSGGDTLARLLARARQVRTKAVVPTLNVAAILQWADEHHSSHGEWPHRDSGNIESAPGETWRMVDAALNAGGRGLPEASSLAQLLEIRRGASNKRRPPRLTDLIILTWADNHHQATGQWPTAESGPVLGANGETWLAINLALHEGLRGLPGADSLRHLLRRHRQVGGRRSPLEPKAPTVRQLRSHADRLRGEGLTIEGIAHRMNLTPRKVAGLLGLKPIETRGRKPDWQRRQQIQRLRQRGLTMKQIAVRLGITPQAVQQFLKAAPTL